jgi:hypothetical protein
LPERLAAGGWPWLRFNEASHAAGAVTAADRAGGRFASCCQRSRYVAAPFPAASMTALRMTAR